jgi:class 3 adenylate cyclase
VDVASGNTAATAERRQVTVMFSDLVGSTALSARMDPEDLRDVISAYQSCVAQTVRRLDRFVAKYLGDGALVYFGYPQAHEDDAERAVRAGLSLIAGATALKSPVLLQTRVGIATGLVVVGDLIKSEDALERNIVGETPNLAARLQGIAEPNMVVIADSTRRLLGNLFELQDLGPQDLKGIARPTPAWAALKRLPIRLTISGVGEEGSALGPGDLSETGGDGLGEARERKAGAFDRICAHLSQHSLQFGEQLFDGIEIRAVGRKVERDGTPSFDCLGDAIDMMDAHIVEEHDVDVAPT